MGGPWEEYQTAKAAPERGPWSDYAPAPAGPQPPGNIKEMTTGEFIAGLPITRLAMGAASPLIAAVQAGAHIGDKLNEAMGVEPVVSPWIDQKLQAYETAKRRGMEGRGQSGFDWMGLLGSLAPSGAISKGVSEAIPAANLATKMLAGGASGAATAAAQPVTTGNDFWTQKAQQVGQGGAIGAAIPLAAQTVMAGKALVEPFYEKGREQIIGRLLNRASGGQEQQVQQSLLNAKPLVPGSEPTVAQASQNAGIASLERAASAVSPEATVAAQGRAAAQNQARLDALSKVAGDENLMAQAIKARGDAANQQYGAAFAKSVQPDQTFATLIQRPSMQKAMQRAADLAKETGEAFDPTSVKGLHFVKLSLDDLQSNPERFGMGAQEARALGKTKDAFVDWLESKVPEYGLAREAYKAGSAPINQMEIGKEILSKATNPKGDVTLFPYARALSDKTAQRVTGIDTATLEKTMTPDQLKTLNAVREDLVRAATARDIAGTAGSDTVRKLAYSNLIDRMGVPTFLREFAPTQITGNLLARGADSVYGKANREIAEQLAATLLNPQEAGRLMQGAGPSRYAAIIDELMRKGAVVGGVGAGQFVNEQRR
jgi:hypothetical protein